MNKSVGHRYRVRFSILLWVVMLVLFEMAPSSTWFVQNPNSRSILMAVVVLTLAFTILTFMFWLWDKRRKPTGVK